MLQSYIIRETDQYYPLSVLFHDSGMEIEISDTPPSGVVKELWGSAKVPDYYYRLGWKKMDWDTSPKVGVNCHSCSKRGKTCFPAIIKMEL